MDGDAELNAPPSDKDGEQRSFGEIFDELCPYFMSIGVSCDEFWHGDPCRLKYYVRAHDYALEEENGLLHLLGGYVYSAVMAAEETLSWRLGGARGRRPEGYVQYPTPITDIGRAAELERKKRETVQFFMNGQKQAGDKK